MQPIGPLMTEHRLIERLVSLIQQELERIQSNVAVDPEFAFVDPVFIDLAVDFLQTYADRCHHGKEEEIFFAALRQKPLRPEHLKLMAELEQEHVQAREATAQLLQAKIAYLRQEEDAVGRVLAQLGLLAALYPGHIAKEDQEFFFPCLDYFTPAERAEILQRMYDFDRSMIHEKYRGIVEQNENRRSCTI